MDKLDNISSISDCCFTTLVGMAPIRVPKIQRDYAQGRRNDSVDDIRNKFVNSLIDAVRNGTSMEMDFIYGSNSKDAFEPLDGQQRLTTMFLLHWMLGVSLFNKENEESVLSYETRNTSKEFTLELVKHEASSYRKEIDAKKESKNKSIEAAKDNLTALEERFEDKTAKEYLDQKKVALEELKKAEAIHIPSFSELIRCRDWFDYLWRYDPSIQSMLVMIDTIYEKMDWGIDLDAARKNLDKITFSYLNLGYFGLSDELFIKMNARGKQLSSFDITKSTLEEEIQIQIKEQHCSSALEAEWRSMVDGEWIDWFWNMYAAPHINSITASEEEYRQRLGYAKGCEEKLKRLILRTIALEFQSRSSIEGQLDGASYNDDALLLDRLMTIYQESLRESRKDGGIADRDAEIDFAELIRDIRCLYYKEDGVYKSALDLVPSNFRINEKFRNASSLDIFLDEKNPNDARVIFFALQSYLKEFPIKLIGSDGMAAEEGSPEATWLSDFVYWAHACRNIFINDNNNVRIDRILLFKNAINAVKVLISSLAQHMQDPQAQDRSIIGFFASMSGKTITGIDNQALAEEVQKALLCSADKAWEKTFSDIEEHSYIWGQVRAVIDWSGKDRTKFEDYGKRLIELLSFTNSDLVHAGLVALTPDFGFKNNKLFVLYNKDRDYSMKRYLRDEAFHNQAGCYAPAMKNLIDKWLKDYPSLPVNEFLQKVIEEYHTKPNSYRRCLVCNHDMLQYAWFKMIYEHKGHYVLAQKKTNNSHCHDIALYYLATQLKTVDNIHIFSSADIEHQYALTYASNGTSYIIQQADDGAYEMRDSVSTIRTFANEKELLDEFDKLYNLR